MRGYAYYLIAGFGLIIKGLAAAPLLGVELRLIVKAPFPHTLADHPQGIQICVGVRDVNYFNSKEGCEFILESDCAADLPRTSLLSHGEERLRLFGAA